MIISDLEHLEDVTTASSPRGGSISGGLSSLLNLDEINKILAKYNLPKLTLGKDNKIYTVGGASASSYKIGTTTYSLSSGTAGTYQVSSSYKSSVASS